MIWRIYTYHDQEIIQKGKDELMCHKEINEWHWYYEIFVVIHSCYIYFFAAETIFSSVSPEDLTKSRMI
jgi:hypothetical protein